LASLATDWLPVVTVMAPVTAPCGTFTRNSVAVAPMISADTSPPNFTVFSPAVAEKLLPVIVMVSPGDPSNGVILVITGFTGAGESLFLQEIMQRESMPKTRR